MELFCCTIKQTISLSHFDACTHCVNLCEWYKTFFIRILFGLGEAASFAAILGIMIQLFPNKVASVLALIETMHGVGYAIGTKVLYCMLTQSDVCSQRCCLIRSRSTVGLIPVRAWWLCSAVLHFWCSGLGQHIGTGSSPPQH